MSQVEPAPRQERWLLWFGVAAAVIAVLAVGIVAISFFIGLSNEMACVDGELPANNTQGGSACYEEGSDLPVGWTWDPRGNYELD